MEPISLETWQRKPVFDFFSRMSDPFFSVTFRTDVTALYRFVKERQISFYYAMIYLCTQAVNRVDAFHYLVQNGQLYRLERRSPSFTDMHPGAEQFHIVTMPCQGDIVEFCRDAKARSMAQTEFMVQAAETDDLIYFSCLPWVELTALTNERDFDPDDAIPRISWGKFTEENERKFLHISMELNHRFTDGIHVGRFHEELTALMDAL